jgi:uncharacterized protein (TIGR00251 family)
LPWYRRTADGWLLALHVQPGAKTSAAAGRHGDALKIRIAAQPMEGKANAALIAFIAAKLGVPKRQVSVERGASPIRALIRPASKFGKNNQILF